MNQLDREAYRALKMKVRDMQPGPERHAVIAEMTAMSEAHDMWVELQKQKGAAANELFKEQMMAKYGGRQAYIKALEEQETQLLGDTVTNTLKKVGITPERVGALKAWLGLGSDCGCGKRQEFLNRLHQSVLDGKIKEFVKGETNAS